MQSEKQNKCTWNPRYSQTLVLVICLLHFIAPFPGQTSGFYNSIELNFVLEKATGNLVTDPAITSQATGTFLGAGSGSTCGIIRDVSLSCYLFIQMIYPYSVRACVRAHARVCVCVCVYVCRWGVCAACYVKLSLDRGPR